MLEKHGLINQHPNGLSPNTILYAEKLLRIAYEPEITKETEELHILNGRHLPQNELVAQNSKFILWTQ